MDSPSRSLVKALTWRVMAAVITTLVAWAVTGDTAFAATIGLADTMLKLGAYYMHERTWNRVSFGRPKEPEYYI